MRCPDCGAEMKPLATSTYCPNDCDRKVQEEIDPEKTPKIIYPESSDLTLCGFGGSSTADDSDEFDWIDNLSWDTD